MSNSNRPQSPPFYVGPERMGAKTFSSSFQAQPNGWPVSEPQREEGSVANRSGQDRYSTQRLNPLQQGMNHPLLRESQRLESKKKKSSALSDSEALNLASSSNPGASKWVSAFKVTSAILVTGAMNAFLFGVPLHTAATLSLLVAGFQSVVALKIHREDNRLSRALVQKTRWLMGREKDQTASGKEWAMVPIWGGVCATSGLMEAVMNHAILTRRKSLAAAEGKQYEPPTLESRQASLKTSAQETRFGFLRRIYEFQSNSLDWMRTQKDKLGDKLNHMKANSQAPMRQRFAKGMEWLLARVQKSSGGRNIPLGYFWAMFTAATGGMVQTAMAAKLQEKIEDTHATHPTAPKPTAIKNREPAYFPDWY